MTRSDGQIKRTKPLLWEKCKEEAIKKMGDFSAKSVDYASILYKQRGGSYSDQKNTNSNVASINKKVTRTRLS